MTGTNSIWGRRLELRIAYLDCLSGISGDMILGALIDVGVDEATIREALASLHIEGLSLQVDRVDKVGIRAVKATVMVDGHEQDDGHEGNGHSHEDGGHHHHRSLADVLYLIEESSLSPEVKEKASLVFERLAEAEARIHGTSKDDIHFHEVGAVDAIADVVGAVAGLLSLDLDMIYCSPLPASSGSVRMSHGIYPLPAPAALELCKGFLLRPDPVTKELVTPTGAAIAAVFAEPTETWPDMRLSEIGYGAGNRDLEGRPNVLRLVLGTRSGQGSANVINVIEANIDDMNPEFYAYVSERLFEAGALDVSLIPAYMKKGRPGTLISVISSPADTEQLIEIMLRETTTIGTRIYSAWRAVAERSRIQVDTPYGPIHVKQAFVAGRLVNMAPEYEDCRLAAASAGVPLKDVYAAAEAAARRKD